MKNKFFFSVLFFAVLFFDISNAQNAGIIMNKTTATSAITMVISSVTSLVIPGDVKLNYSSDYILNNGTCYIAGNVINNGNSFDVPAATGTEIFNGSNSVISGSNSVFNNFTILGGATVTLSGASIDIYNNWNNSGKFVNSSRIVTFSGTVAPVQYIIGTGTFYTLNLQNKVNFGSSKDTIEYIFNNNATGALMVDGTSQVVFKNPSSITGAKAKNFYDLEILGGANVSHISGIGDIHVAHSFINNGNLTEDPTHTFYFDSISALPVTETMSGSGTATFGNFTVSAGINTGSYTILNTGNSNFTIAGNNLSFNHTGASINSTGNITFALDKTLTGNISIKNASTVTGTSANFYNVNIDSATTTNTPVATALDFGSNISKISNTLQINPSGSVTLNAPLYGSAATLIYNTTTPNLPTSYEWNTSGTTPGLGVPYNVTIQNSNNIVMAGNRGVGGTLNILTGDALSLNNYTLTVNGNFSGTGTLTGSHISGLTIGSSGSAGTAYFTSAVLPNLYTNNYLKTLTLNTGSSLAIGDSLNITAGMGGTYGSTSGNLLINGTLNTGDYLTLKSNGNGDAIAGRSTGTPVINGNVTVERYIPAKRAWRFLSVTANDSRYINTVWQEGGINIGFGPMNTQNPNPGFGTEITYDNLAAHGFDYNTTYNPSIKVWDAITNDWSTVIPYTNSTPINTNAAYCLFVRGSRLVDLSLAVSAPADNTILRTTGGLNYGNYVKSYISSAGNAILVSNPYACPIDLTSVLSNNSAQVNNKFYVWDPGANGSYGVGMLLSYSGGGSLTVPSGSSYTGGVNAQSGQAFLLEAKNSGTTNLSFAEGDKVISETNVFNKIIKHTPVVYANLMIASGNSLSLVDGVGAGFGKSFSTGVDADDVNKLANFEENMMLVRGNATLAIELRSIPVLTDTLFYRLYLKQQPYTLQIFAADLPADFPKAWLVDKYLNTKTEVNLSDTTLYNFSPNTDTNSYRNRFMLVFKSLHTATPVATTMSSVNSDAASIKGSVSVFPNPVVTGEKIYLNFKNIKAGKYEVTVNSLEGKALAVKTIQHTGSSSDYFMQLNKRWTTGNYIIKISGKDGFVTTTKLLIGK